MIHKTRNRLPRQGTSPNGIPSHDEIQALCRQIRSRWTAAQRRHRAVRSRMDAPDPRFEAHLRFVEFLLARTESNGCAEPDAAT
jgi:hypothetical protein